MFYVGSLFSLFGLLWSRRLPILDHERKEACYDCFEKEKEINKRGVKSLKIQNVYDG